MVLERQREPASGLWVRAGEWPLDREGGGPMGFSERLGERETGSERQRECASNRFEQGMAWHRDEEENHGGERKK
ncbi:hypothetical protein AMTR_s00053p00167750 [Amborella trichopoda]|uniref:Uncharacterized protein n=1 Tax=Amborella trichopoda TaxID=13333 RepID=W1P5D6_AMBTC|nr:hypothetical protein AMTR_s00053p00167750 [Amborella trichopoda]